MKRYPEVPRAADAPPDLFESGHLWLQERVDGAHLRFRLRESGLLEFGDRTRTFDDTDDMPASYRHAVRRVRASFDREALRAARDDPASVVFFGEATVRRRIDYDWDRVPAVLGFDVWDADADRFLPPDAVEQVFDRVGLDPVNAVAKEVRAADFDPGDYDVPESAWYDGPAAGVVVRNKTGGRAVIPNPEVADLDESAPVDPSAEDAEERAEELAERFVTPERVERVAADLDDRGQRATFDAVFERAFEAVAREEHHLLFGESASVDVQAFRSAVAARVQELFDE
ncbi:RNA ligase family protein [Halorussus sp. AFM4]|uniref:RNA ligase family protein n=1 Tax=Halorussus sp. AFM4 TaxID=3421651 RepID=UPI003EBD6761